MRQVIAHIGNANSRSEQWRSAAAADRFGVISLIPAYNGAAMEASRAALAGWHHRNESVAQPAYRFYQASALHRWFVLRDLLPSHGIVLI